MTVLSILLWVMALNIVQTNVAMNIHLPCKTVVTSAPIAYIQERNSSLVLSSNCSTGESEVTALSVHTIQLANLQAREVVIANSTWIGGSSTSGGCVSLQAAEVYLENVRFVRCNALETGGALLIKPLVGDSSFVLRLSFVTFTSNSITATTSLSSLIEASQAGSCGNKALLPSGADVHVVSCNASEAIVSFDHVTSTNATTCLTLTVSFAANI